MQEFEISGYWFPADAQYDEIPGSLEFDPVNGLSLDLMGRFRSHTRTGPKGERRLDIDTIFGRTTGGTNITLTGCDIAKYTTPREYDHKGRGITRYRPQYCYTGVHSDGGPEFSRISFMLTNLDDWIHGTDVEDIGFRLDTETRFRLSNTTFDRGRPAFYSMEEDDYRVTFEFNSPQEFESVKSDIIRPFQFFISYALESPVFPLLVHGSTEERPMGMGPISEALDIDAFSRYGTSVVYPEPRYRLRQEGDAWGSWTSAHIEGYIKRVLRNWYAKYHQHRPLFDLFFMSLYYDEGNYPSVAVLNLTRGLEAYHRESSQYSSRYIEEEVFEEYRKELEETIPSEFSESFSSHLKHGSFKFANRVSLRKRLEELIHDHEEVLQYRLHEEFDSSEMAGEIKHIRNRLTHLSDEDVSEFDVEGSVLHKLRVLTEVIIADEVGFDPNDIFPFYRKRS